MNRSHAVALAVASLLTFAAAPATADRAPELVNHPLLGDNPSPEAISADGKVVVFETSDPLLPADGDALRDVYAVSGDDLTLVSGRVSGAGANANANFQDITPDGRTIIFETEEQIVAADNDDVEDVYKFANGQTTLMSDNIGIGADPDVEASYEGMTTDGQRVFFETLEPIIGADDDDANDVYEKSLGALRLRTDRTSGADEELPATARFISPDGSQVVFQTDEALIADDGDDSRDIYVTFVDGSNLGLSLLTDRILSGADLNQDVTFRDAAPDGSAILFSTLEQVIDGDGDSSTDVFMRAGGDTTLVSDTVGGATPGGVGRALFSADGQRVFFESDAALAAADTDSSSDVYGFHAGTLSLLSDRQKSGPEEAEDVTLAEASAAHGAVMLAAEPLVEQDGDAAEDLYASVDGPPRLLTDRTQPGPDEGTDVSARVLPAVTMFNTTEPLVAADADAAADLYEVTDSGLQLVADNARGADENKPNEIADTTPDGELVLVATEEALTSTDADATVDAYISRRVPPPPPAQPGPGGPGGPAGPGGPGGPGGETSPPPPGAQAAPPVDVLGPSLARLSIGRRLTLGKTATIKFNSSEAARGTLVFERVTCKKRSRRARRCTKTFKRVGKAVNVDVKDGANSVRFKPGRGFKAGAHRLRLNASDAAGNRARELRANFTLVKRRR
jgi:hypothetical protein